MHSPSPLGDALSLFSPPTDPNPHQYDPTLRHFTTHHTTTRAPLSSPSPLLPSADIHTTPPLTSTSNPHTASSPPPLSCPGGRCCDGGATDGPTTSAPSTLHL
mmetsp:Transcript_10902/g.25532  ORF Transcript_10902/g.25532 Transcript_10902/m.25532 type:complete len:103 (-) Transcript_10902:96-404(-)